MGLNFFEGRGRKKRAQKKRPSDKDRPPKTRSIKRSAAIEDEAKQRLMIDLCKICFLTINYPAENSLIRCSSLRLHTSNFPPFSDTM